MTLQSQTPPNHLPFFENQRDTYTSCAFYPVTDLSISIGPGFKYILIILIFLLL